MRSKFEERLAKTIGPEYQYEAIRLPYVTKHVYVPDWVNKETKQIIEAKGLWDSADRAKILAVKAAHPDYTITMVFQNANLPLYKGSKTSYSAWCDKNGIQWKQAETEQKVKKKRK